MEQENIIAKYSSRLERACWFLVLLGMLTQISTDYSFPSYNVALGFWGAYSSFSRHGRATFGFIIFTFFGVILDVVFCSNNRHSTTLFQFLLAVFILAIFAKGYALYQASRFFTSIGGAYSLESTSVHMSLYDSLSEQRAGYYPPDDQRAGEDGGLVDSVEAADGRLFNSGTSEASRGSIASFASNS